MGDITDLFWLKATLTELISLFPGVLEVMPLY